MDFDSLTFHYRSTLFHRNKLFSFTPHSSVLVNQNSFQHSRPSNKKPVINRAILKTIFALPLEIAYFTCPPVSPSLSLTIHTKILTRRRDVAAALSLSVYTRSEIRFINSRRFQFVLWYCERTLVSANWKLATAADDHMCVSTCCCSWTLLVTFIHAKIFRKLFLQRLFFFTFGCSRGCILGWFQSSGWIAADVIEEITSALIVKLHRIKGLQMTASKFSSCVSIFISQLGQ